MEVTDYPKSSNVLAIAGLVLSIFAFVTSLIPCVGVIAYIPAVLGLIFAIIGLAKSNEYRTQKSVAIIGIILGATALLIAGAWTGIISNFSEHAEEHIEERLEEAIEELASELEDTRIHIQLEQITLSEEEKDRIREEATRAGEVAERIVSDVLSGIHSIKVEASEKRVVIRIPKEEISDEKFRELEEKMMEVEKEIRELVDGFSITVEVHSDDWEESKK
ncbi:MAG: DUF4190 domain-containing protein [Marinilabiliaceae bacterium]|nr:DUF4190 domain-containing protein [Marinilabiliaceae bacterium]